MRERRQERESEGLRRRAAGDAVRAVEEEPRFPDGQGELRGQVPQGRHGFDAAPGRVAHQDEVIDPPHGPAGEVFHPRLVVHHDGPVAALDPVERLAKQVVHVAVASRPLAAPHRDEIHRIPLG